MKSLATLNLVAVAMLPQTLKIHLSSEIRPGINSKLPVSFCARIASVDILGPRADVAANSPAEPDQTDKHSYAEQA